MSVVELSERLVAATTKVNALREQIKDKRRQLLDTDAISEIVNSSSEPDVEASVILIKDMIVCLNTSSLYREGFLDEQFMQLQQLQDESNPESVVEVVSLFFEDAEKLLADLSKTLAQQPVDFKDTSSRVAVLGGFH